MAGATPRTVRLQDLTVDVSLSGVARGDLLFRGANTWNNLAAGTSGYFLRSNGAGADPSWASVSASPAGSSGQVQWNSSSSFAGAAYLNYATSGSILTITDGATTDVPLVVNGAASHTGDLAQFKVNGTTLARVTAGGFLTASGAQSLSGFAVYAGGIQVFQSFYTANNNLLSTTNAVYSPMVVRGTTSQTATLIQLQGTSSTTAGTAQAEIDTAWVDSTHATRKARLLLRVHDTAVREGLRIDADGTYALTAIGGGTVAASTALTVTSPTATYIGQIVKGATSQSANLQEWQNSSGAIQLAISPSGVIDRPEPTATTGASQAGLAISLTASDAVASTDTAGAAAGGNVTIGTGAGARLTSGNAQGGDLLVTFGAGIGTGRQGALVFSNSKAWIGANGGTQGGIGLNNPFNGDVSFGTGSGAFTNPKVIIDNNGGAISMCSGHYLAWSSSATDAGSSADTGLKRSSAGVVTVTGGLSGNGSLLLTAASSSTIPCTIKGAASQSANLQEWSSSALAVYGTVSENGYFTTRKNSAPADAELATSELAFWFDDTDGAAKLKIKAKNSAGTVVTGEVALT